LLSFHARQRRFLRAAQDFGFARIAGEKTAELSCQIGQLHQIAMSKFGLNVNQPYDRAHTPVGYQLLSSRGRPNVNRHTVLQLLSPCCVLSAGIEHKHTGKETHMDTLTTKLAALAGTLFMNALVMGAVAYCFALQPNTYMTAVALAKAVATQQGLG
jgi:hypothetical protein